MSSPIVPRSSPRGTGSGVVASTGCGSPGRERTPGPGPSERRPGARPDRLADTWQRVSERLEQSHDVVRRRRGHGSSDRSEDYSAEAHTRATSSVSSGRWGWTGRCWWVTPWAASTPPGGPGDRRARDRAGGTPPGPRCRRTAPRTWPTAGAGWSRWRPCRRGNGVRSVAGATLVAPRRRRDVVARADLLDPDVVGWFGSWRTRNAWREHVSGLDVPGLLLTGTPSRTRWRVLPGTCRGGATALAPAPGRTGRRRRPRRAARRVRRVRAGAHPVPGGARHLEAVTRVRQAGEVPSPVDDVPDTLPTSCRCGR